MTELVGQTGQWDYIEFVAEYAPWTMHDLDNLGRAIELFPDFSGMIKIEQDTRGHLAMRAMGAGIQNLLFADVRTPDGGAAVRARGRARAPRTRWATRRRHAARRRTVLHGGTAEFVAALADAVVVLMIEKREAVENLEAILDVGGIDMVQFGPSDYSMSLGMPGQTGHERVREAERFTIETAHKRGIPARAEIRDASGAAHYLELGVRHFCVGWDVRILHDWFTDQGQAMRSLLTGELTATPTNGAARPGYA